MPLYKETWKFSSPQGSTWNEVYTTNENSLAEAANFTQEFIDGRLNLLHPSNTWKSVRISEVGAARVTTIVSINQNGKDKSDTAAFTPFPTTVAAVINLASAVQPARRYLWLSGMDVGDVILNNDTGAAHLSASWQQCLTTFISKLAKNNYVILALEKKNPLDPFDYRIISVGPNDSSGRTTLTMTANPAGVVKGSTIILSGFDQKQYPGLKGNFTVLEIAGAVVTVQYVPPRNVITSPTTGKWRIQKYLTNPKISPQLSAFAYLGKRDRKNFFTNSRGAKRADRLRNLV